MGVKTNDRWVCFCVCDPESPARFCSTVSCSPYLAFALPLGLVVAFRLHEPVQAASGAAVKTFVWVIRGTPLMLQIIVIYLGPGLLGMTNPWPSGSGGMVAAVVAFAINYACYFSEIYRGGIEAVPQRARPRPGRCWA